MKFPILTMLLPLVLASLLCERKTDGCVIEGTRGTIPDSVNQRAFRRITGSGNVEACRAKCHLPENAACKAFGIREATGAGACLLFDFDISSSVRENAVQNTVYYVLPTGIVGGTPHDNPAWYEVDNTKTRGTYVGCRELCLTQTPRCKGFSFKPQGNCRLYEDSLAGRVVEGPRAGVYDHNQVDCAFIAPPTRATSA